MKGDVECENRRENGCLCHVVTVMAEQKPVLFHQYLSIPRNFATGTAYKLQLWNIFGNALAFTRIRDLNRVAAQHGIAVGNNEAAHSDWTGASQMLRP